VGDKPKARVNPGRAAQPAGRGAPARPTAPAERPAGRGAAAPAAATDTGEQEPVEAPERGIVTDAPRKSAQPGLRAEVKTQDEVEIATLKGKIAFFEEENRKLKAQVVKVQETSAHDAAAGARADAE